MRSTIFFIAATLCLFTQVHSQHLTYTGHWEKTWNVSSTRFDAANYGFAFSGHVDIDNALTESTRVYGNLEGRRILTIGGGNSIGYWTSQQLGKLNNAIQAGRLSEYDGIAYDIEEGDSGLTADFLKSFEVAKAHRLIVVVAISHTAPYGLSDEEARYLMFFVIFSRNVDVISPMMYRSGNGYDQCNDPGIVDYVDSKVPWSWYGYSSNAAIVPSLWRSSQYSEAQTFLKGQNISTSGYIAWCT